MSNVTLMDEIDITTAETPTMLESLATAAWYATNDESDRWEDALAIEKHPYVLMAEAVVRGMQGPYSETLAKAGVGANYAMNAEKAMWLSWQAMLQHILDGGK